MAELAHASHDDTGGGAAARKDHSTGILPSQALRTLIDGGEIRSRQPIEDHQIQPASLDLRLGAVAHRVQSSFLPGRGATVTERIAPLCMHSFGLEGGAVLEKGCVYIVELAESLALRKPTSGFANPKSSTGRLDIFTRLITDHGTEFDRVPAGYEGPLYIEISPRTFSILVRAGARLNQLRIKRGSPQYSDREQRQLQATASLVDADLVDSDIRGGVPLTVDLDSDSESGLVGYRARQHAGLIDLDKIDYYDPLAFWEPVRARSGGGLILDPADFYILASKESVKVPLDYAAEMVAYDTLVGEFRVHYAGFFDPGFGHSEAGGEGTRAVLEVRSHEVPFLIEHGQTVGRLMYERLTAVPDRIYGMGIGSSYQRQGLALSKHFKRYP